MEIQLQKFNGRNFYDNCVEVDFEKQTVGFIPVVDGGMIKYYFVFSCCLVFVSSFFGLYLFLGFVLTNFLFNYFGLVALYHNQLSSLFSLTLILFTIIIPFPLSLLFFNKNFRENHYPLFNARLFRFYRTLRSFGLINFKKREINPDAIIDNKFIVPAFDNIFLEYEVYGDFAKQLKKISITNLYKNKGGDFNCVFEFRQKPKGGFLKLDYM